MVCDPDEVAASRTSGRPVAFGETLTGKYLACVYELLDDVRCCRSARMRWRIDMAKRQAKRVRRELTAEGESAMAAAREEADRDKDSILADGRRIKAAKEPGASCRSRGVEVP